MKVRILLPLLIALLLPAFAASAQQFEGLNVKQYSFVRLRPAGLRSLAGTVEFTLDNTGETRSFRNLRGVAFKDGVPFMEGWCEDMVLEQGVHTYRVSGKVRLADGISIFKAISAALSFQPEKYSLNFSLTLTHENGREEDILRRDLPVSHFLGKAVQTAPAPTE